MFLTVPPSSRIRITMGGPGSSTTICVIRAGVLESVSIQKRKTQIVRLQADRMRQYPVIAPGSSLSTRPSLLNYVLIGFPPASECMMSGLREVAQGKSDSSAGSVSQPQVSHNGRSYPLHVAFKRNGGEQWIEPYFRRRRFLRRPSFNIKVGI